MALTWLITLITYGLLVGWDKIDILAWWLLVTFFLQDWWDLRKR